MGINQVPPVVATPEVVSYGTPGTYTFTPPAGTSEGNPAYARVVITGAGGGGGAQTVGRSGAGGSAGQQIILPSVKITGNTSITVGAGGAGATTAGATATAGGSSVFGSITALGGAGAIAGAQGAAPALMPASSRGATGADGARFILFSQSNNTNQIRYSADGLNWTVVDGPRQESPISAFVNNGRMFTCTTTGSSQYVISYSTNGTSWSTPTMPIGNYKVNGYASQGNTILAAGDTPNSGGPTNQYMYSTNNGDTWTAGSFPLSKPWATALTNGSIWVVASQSDEANNIRTNTTLGGASAGWTQRNIAGSNNNWYGGAYGNGRFILTSFGGKIISSTDGITWTERATGQGSLFNAVYTGNLFFTRNTGSTSTSYLYSSDGETWNTGNLPAGSESGNAWMFGFVAGTYYCITSTGRVHTSSNGINWTYTVTLDSTYVSSNGTGHRNAPLPYLSLGTVSGNQPTAVSTYVGDLPPTGGSSGNPTSTTGSGGSGGGYIGASAAASTGSAAATVGQVPGAGGGGGGTGSTAGAAGADGLVAIYL
jgi:hypothetical protein